MTDASPANPPAAPKRENILLSLVCNIAAPSLALSYLCEERFLGPDWGFAFALSFPLVYGVWDFARRRKANFISILGFVSVLATGSLGLMQLDGFWFAVKEAAVPSLIGLMVLLSMGGKRPLVRELLINDQVIDLPKVEAALDARGTRPQFERQLARSSYLIAASMLISAVLNFCLARLILKSPPHTPAFDAELGRMNWLSWPVIMLPTMAMMMFALWKLLNGLQALTGLEIDDMFHAKPEGKSENREGKSGNREIGKSGNEGT
jgi:hypothetical protein